MKKTVTADPRRLNADGYGDFVKCNDCGNLSIIQLGGTVCPHCSSENLSWADDDHEECHPVDLERMGYRISFVDEMTTSLPSRKHGPYFSARMLGEEGD